LEKGEERMSDDELVLQKTAEAAERSGDLEAALDIWRNLSSIDAIRPDYLCKLGRVARRLGRWADAEQAFLGAIGIDKTFSFGMTMLGHLFLARTDGDRLTNAKKAKVWLERAVEEAPSQFSLIYLGSAYLRLGEREAAKKVFSRSIDLYETYNDPYYNLGILCTDDGQRIESERLHRIAIAEAHYNLGLLLADDGQNIEAEKLLRRATQLDPNSHHAHGRLGILLQDQGRYSEAESELRRAIEIDPTDKIARRYLGRVPQT
jgi:tetratricopeptide (TPR) repeat protein